VEINGRDEVRETATIFAVGTKILSQNSWCFEWNTSRTEDRKSELR